MELPYFKQQAFGPPDFTDSWTTGEYDRCTFDNCDLSGAELSASVFDHCTFRNCNLSATRLQKTVLRAAVFVDCKILGTRFDICDTFLLTMSFTNCALNYSTFHQLAIRHTQFLHCHLTEVDFSECDLTGSVFDGCSLSGARFDEANLADADLSKAFGYTILPERTRIHGARFAWPEAAGLLTHYGIELVSAFEA